MSERTDHFEAHDLRSTVHHMQQLVLILTDVPPPGQRQNLDLTQNLIDRQVGLVIVALELRLFLPMQVNLVPNSSRKSRDPQLLPNLFNFGLLLACFVCRVHADGAKLQFEHIPITDQNILF